MVELRILSGLHRGAVLPLDDAPYLIGASDDADVVLTDSGIAERHAVLSAAGSAWVLTVEGGQIYSSESNSAQTAIDLEGGGFARIGDIWISIAEEGAPWDKPPPLPEPEDFDLNEDAPVSEQSSEQAASKVERGLGRRVMLGGVAVATAFFAVAAYAITAKLETASQSRDASLSKVQQFGSMPGTAQSAPSTRNLEPKELQTAFRRRLAEADLLGHFDMELQDRAWSMQANLGAEESSRFNRILSTFIAENHIDFPIRANLVGAEAMLPFEIRQVVSGANPNIVTKEGQRLFVGEEFRGVRVIAIEDNHLIFAGKRKIEMNW